MSYSVTLLVILKSYLDDNAGVFGSLNDQDAAVAMNASTKTRIKPTLAGSELLSETDPGEYGLLTPTARTEWLSFCAIDSVGTGNSGLAAPIVTRIFGNPSVTRTRLLAARSESISPAQEQGLPRVRADYVRRARLLP